MIKDNFRSVWLTAIKAALDQIAQGTSLDSRCKFKKAGENRFRLFKHYFYNYTIICSNNGCVINLKKVLVVTY